MKHLKKLIDELFEQLYLSENQKQCINTYLEWAFAVGYEQGIIDQKDKYVKYKKKPVRRLALNGSHEDYESCAEAARQNKVPKPSVLYALWHETKYKGYFWYYKDESDF